MRNEDERKYVRQNLLASLDEREQTEVGLWVNMQNRMTLFIAPNTHNCALPKQIAIILPKFTKMFIYICYNIISLIYPVKLHTPVLRKVGHYCTLHCTIPLKFGLMRASYPDVRPISLSRKSDGDGGLTALLGNFISLQEPGLKGRKGETGV